MNELTMEIFMKTKRKIIATLLLSLTALTASARDGWGVERSEHHGFSPIPGHGGGYYGGYRVGPHYGYGASRGYYDEFGHFLAPALIGGVIGYGLAQPRVVSPNVVYTTPTTVYAAPSAVYSEPQPMVYSAPIGYHYENILDANCNCYRTVLIANQ
jgi:hypothetical protein